MQGEVGSIPTLSVCSTAYPVGSGRGLRYNYICNYSMVGMAFEWDPDKNQANIEKHGVPFEVAKRIFDGTVVRWLDTRKDYGEDRYIGIGKVVNASLVVVYTDRGGNIRLISARPASRKEREKYSVQIR